MELLTALLILLKDNLIKLLIPNFFLTILLLPEIISLSLLITLQKLILISLFWISSLIILIISFKFSSDSSS